MLRRTSVIVLAASLLCVGACSSDDSTMDEMVSSTPLSVETTELARSTMQFAADLESTASPTSTTTTTTTTTTATPTSTAYVVPVADVDAAGWGSTHSGYPATDIFAACGAEIVSPVNGSVLESRIVDGWDPQVDNPATRGGRSVAVLGDDGVRYYMAHMEAIDPAVVPGARVDAGRYLGTVGETGRASACHLHFSISPPCPGKEWSVRRGVIWPSTYLDAWRAGEQPSPADEVARWVAAHPDACAVAMSDPNAPDA
jgi:murein DD-endopeptidase MepM/ murein hydrolase activator NlpD